MTEKKPLRFVAKAIMGVQLRGTGPLIQLSDDMVGSFIEESGQDRADIIRDTKEMTSRTTLANLEDILEGASHGLDGELIFKQVNQSIIALDSDMADVLLPALWKRWMRQELPRNPRFFLIESNNESPIAGYRKIVGDQHYAWAECRYPALKLGKTFHVVGHLYALCSDGALRPMPYPDLNFGLEEGW